MNDLQATREQLLQELAELRSRLGVLEASEIERKPAEEALRDSEERFHNFASHTYDWECWHDTEGKLIYSSPSCYRMTGYSAEEFYADLGGTLQKLIYPADSEVVAAHEHSALAGPDPLRLEYRILTRSGEIRWLEHYCQSVYDSKGQYSGRRSCNRDITEQKRVEDMLQRAHLEMEQRVQERTAELAKTVEQLHNEVQERIGIENALQRERRTLEYLLRSSDHERQLIAYEIHDGLAQYLAGAIMQFQSHIASKATNPELAAKSFDAGMAMLQQGHSEARYLISGVRPPILDESGVVAAITQLVHEQEHQGGMKGEFVSQIKFDRLDSIVENVIYRIIQECLSNARKHSGSKKARVEMVQCEDHLRIEIRDWGKGFSIDAEREGCFGSKGVQERARLLGGNVVMESIPGQGTRIVANLPIS